MDVLEEGSGELIGFEHPDDARRFNREETSRALEDKCRSGEAVVENVS